MTLAQIEREEGTTLERNWRQYLQVPFYAIDDSDLRTFASCQWVPKLPFHHLVFVPTSDSVPVYQNSHSQLTRRFAARGELFVARCAPVVVHGVAMVPIESGGSVAIGSVRPATLGDLGLNPALRIVDLDDRIPKVRRRRQPTIGVAPQESAEQFADDCLVQSLWNLKCRVRREDGPHWALADGNRLLLSLNKRLRVVLDTNELKLINLKASGALRFCCGLIIHTSSLCQCVG